jgi:hypothetical protein
MPQPNRKGPPLRDLKHSVSYAAAISAPLLSLFLGTACTPTVRVEVAPINIYARLDADVRVRLDQEVQTLIQQNPNLF